MRRRRESQSSVLRFTAHTDTGSGASHPDLSAVGSEARGLPYPYNHTLPVHPFIAQPVQAILPYKPARVGAVTLLLNPASACILSPPSPEILPLSLFRPLLVCSRPAESGTLPTSPGRAVGRRTSTTCCGTPRPRRLVGASSGKEVSRGKKKATSPALVSQSQQGSFGPIRLYRFTPPLSPTRARLCVV